MPLSDILAPEGVMSGLKASGKRQVLEEMSRRAAQISGLDPVALLDIVQQRERLGSTGVGEGIAIPHGKSPHIRRIMGVFARLDKGVDFSASDNQPVDLVFMLLAPEDAGADHLKALARVARLLRDPGMVESLRASREAATLYALLTQTPASVTVTPSTAPLTSSGHSHG